MEEGKLSEIVQGVKLASLTKKEDKNETQTAATVQRKATDEAAKNVVAYINHEQGGHLTYGMGYLFCQVNINIKLL